MLILEVMLTVAAWKRGWKAAALLPCAAALIYGFMVGLNAAASGGGHVGPGVLILGDVIAIVALAVMAAVAPRGAAVRASVPAAGEQSPEAERKDLAT